MGSKNTMATSSKNLTYKTPTGWPRAPLSASNAARASNVTSMSLRKRIGSSTTINSKFKRNEIFSL